MSGNDKPRKPPRDPKKLQKLLPPLFPPKGTEGQRPANEARSRRSDASLLASASADDRAVFEADLHDEANRGRLEDQAASLPIRREPTDLQEDFWPSPDTLEVTSAGLIEGPSGPNPRRIREIMAALEAETALRRRPNESAAKPAGPFVQDAGYKKEGARRLRHRYLRENGLPLTMESIDPVDFARWVLPFKLTQPQSWRLRRNTAIAVIQSNPHSAREAALAMLHGDGRRRGERARKVDERKIRKYGVEKSRAEFFDYDHYKEFQSSFRKLSRAAAIDWLNDWLIAGLCTGLTPSEWPLAQIEVRKTIGTARKIWLHVPQVGSSSSADSIAFRTLDISRFSKPSLTATLRMVGRSRRWALKGEMQARRLQCAQLFDKLCSDLFPTKAVLYSLHSLRAQFIANMSVKMEPDEVCTLAGTLDVGREREHYAKRRIAWDPDLIKDVPKPLKEQVEQVRKTLKRVEDLRYCNALRAGMRSRRKKKKAAP